MTDDTPTGDTPTGDTPTGDTPTGDTEAVEPTITDPETAEPVTVADAAEAPAEPPTAVPVAVPVAAQGEPPQRRGVFVPAWVAAVLALLVIGGIGFAIGYAIADDNDSSPSSASSSEVVPEPVNPPGGNRGNDDNSGRAGTGIAYLGVSVEAVGDDDGVRITAVGPNSPAAEAGLRVGDIITRIDDTSVRNGGDLVGAIRSEEPGDDVDVTYTRDGNSAEVEVELGSRPGVQRGIPS